MQTGESYAIVTKEHLGGDIDISNAYSDTYIDICVVDKDTQRRENL